MSKEYRRDNRVAARLQGKAMVSTRTQAGILHNGGDPALAWDETVLAEGKQDGAELLIVFIGADIMQTRYEVRLRVMEFYGIRRKMPTGWQRVLPLKYWSINSQPPAKPVQFVDEQPPAPEDPQGSLF